VLRSLFSGVSGMDANQEWIDTIGNDIANVNTTGYKSNEVQFEDLLSQTLAGSTAPNSTQGGVNPTQVGLGVKVAGVAANFTEGTMEQTGNPLDLSIQGNGFFIAQSNGTTYYTRAGSLNLDGNGNLVTPDGSLVQGWPANAQGAINNNAPLGALTIPAGQQIAANTTQAVTLGGNLAGQSGWAPPGGGGSGNAVGTATSVTVYSANGAKETLDLDFQQDATLPSGAPQGAASAWTVQGALTAPGGTPSYATGAGSTATLYFNASGNLIGYTDQQGQSSTTATSFSLTVPDQTPGAASGATKSFTLNVPTVTANASDDTVSVISQNGNAPGSLQSFSIGSNGVVQGVFSNGQTLNLGQIALASFANPDGLLRTGDSNFTQTANSGLAQVGQAGNGSLGQISAGSLEASNVNLATEMTNLIEAQNGFQANGSVISTSNTLLQNLVNLKGPA
jgi:flagellar hook protein FlgE